MHIQLNHIYYYYYILCRRLFIEYSYWHIRFSGFGTANVGSRDTLVSLTPWGFDSWWRERSLSYSQTQRSNMALLWKQTDPALVTWIHQVQIQKKHRKKRIQCPLNSLSNEQVPVCDFEYPSLVSPKCCCYLFAYWSHAPFRSCFFEPRANTGLSFCSGADQQTFAAKMFRLAPPMRIRMRHAWPASGWPASVVFWGIVNLCGVEHVFFEQSMSSLGRPPQQGVHHDRTRRPSATVYTEQSCAFVQWSALPNPKSKYIIIGCVHVYIYIYYISLYISIYMHSKWHIVKIQSSSRVLRGFIYFSNSSV